jgi:hypothetical protein
MLCYNEINKETVGRGIGVAKDQKNNAKSKT